MNIEISKEQVKEFVTALQEVNQSISRFILFFTMGLMIILFEYANTFDDRPVDIFLVMLMYFLIAANINVLTYLVNSVNIKSMILIVLIVISIIICTSLIPAFGYTYESSGLMLVIYKLANPLIGSYVCYLVSFGMIKHCIDTEENRVDEFEVNTVNMDIEKVNE